MWDYIAGGLVIAAFLLYGFLCIFGERSKDYEN